MYTLDMYNRFEYIGLFCRDLIWYADIVVQNIRASFPVKQIVNYVKLLRFGNLIKILYE